MDKLVKYFNWKVRKGFEARGLAGKEEYESRLVEETRVIRKMGYESYLLVVGDFIAWARRKDIPVGPGRGSAAGCLISYCLSITNIDPIKYKLLFERFLNPDRVSMPDIDVDFCKDRVDEVIDYVIEKYGRDHVAKIKTFGKLYAKSAIRDVGRVKELDPTKVAEAANAIPHVITQDDQKLERMYKSKKHGPLLNAMKNGKKGPEIKYLFATAEKLEELVRNASTHAAGVVIGPRPLVEYMGLDLDVKNQQPITAFDMNDCERLGLIKFDFLSLDTLTQIALCIKIIGENHGVEIDIDEIPEDDQLVWQLMDEGRLGGIFQMGSEGFTRLTTRLKPRSIEDLAIISSVYRPGPMKVGIHEKIIKARRTGEPIYDHAALGGPAVAEILSTTSGAIIYQEQCMRIARYCAGYTPGETDNLRKMIGKKLIEKMEDEMPKFVQGMVDNSYTKTYAEFIWKEMERFGAYGFNKSHAISYARISYETAYLKAHYPAEFLAASLTMKMDSQKREAMLQLMYECKDIDIPIMPPDINISKSIFMARDNRVFYGLGAIKGLGVRTIDHILEVRDEGLFDSMQDFVERTKGTLTDTGTLDVLAKAGAFDSLEPDRGLAIEQVQLLASAWREKRRKEAQKKAKLFRNLDKFKQDGKARGYKSIENLQARVNQELIGIQTWYDETVTKVNKMRSPRETYDILAYEVDLLGFYLQGHPLDRCEWVSSKYSIENALESDEEMVNMVGVITDVKLFQTKARRQWMSTFYLSGKEAQVKCIAFPRQHERQNHLIEENRVVFIEGKKNNNEVYVEGIRDTGCLTRKGVAGAEVKAILDPGTANRIKHWLEKQKEANVNTSLPFSLELEGLKGAVELDSSKLVSELLLTEMDAKLAGLNFKWTKTEE